CAGSASSYLARPAPPWEWPADPPAARAAAGETHGGAAGRSRGAHRTARFGPAAARAAWRRYEGLPETAPRGCAQLVGWRDLGCRHAPTPSGRWAVLADSSLWRFCL